MKTYLILAFAAALMVACAGGSGLALRAATQRAFATVTTP